MLGGLQTGYDRRFGTCVLGAVADIQAADFPGRPDRYSLRLPQQPAECDRGDYRQKSHGFGTVRAQGHGGVAMGDWLAYGTRGLAYGNADSSIGLACTPGGAGFAPTSRSRAIDQRSGSAGARVLASRRCSR